MNLAFNSHGELHVDENELKYITKLSNLDYKDIDFVADEYKKMIENHYIISDYFINAYDITQNSHYVSFLYDLTDYRNFHKMRDINFKDKVYMYNDLIEIAKFSEKEEVKVLWSPLNFYIDTEHNKIKGLLFEFYPLYISKQFNNLEGIKDIIIHTLTSVEKRLGKPRYDDFIEKDQYVIEYVEKLLSCNNLKEVEILTRETIQSIEEQEEQERQELIKKQENRKIKIPKLNKKEVDPKEEKRKRIKKQLLANENLGNGIRNNNTSADKTPFRYKLKNFTQSTMGIATMGVLFLLMIALYLVTDGFSMESNDTAEKEEDVLASQLEQETNLKDIYRTYVTGEEAKAKEQLTGLEYENLSEEDQDLFLDFLIEDEYYSRALSLSDQSAYKIGRIINDDNITEIQRVADGEDSPQLDFYIEIYNENFQNAIDKANELEVIDKQTALDITKAHYLTNQREELTSFIETFAPDPEAEEQDTERTQYYNNLSEANALFNNEYINYTNTQDKLETLRSEVGTLDNKDDKSDSEKTTLKNKQSQLEELEAEEQEEYESLLNMTIEEENSQTTTEE